MYPESTPKRDPSTIAKESPSSQFLDPLLLRIEAPLVAAWLSEEGKATPALQRLRQQLTTRTLYDERLLRRSLNWLKQQALQGNLRIIDYLIELYSSEERTEEARYLRRCLRLAVEHRGTREDLYRLAHHLIYGTVLRPSYREAMIYLHRAAEEEYAEAHFLLSQCYYQGLGGVRSISAYFHHLSIAAEAGLVDAEVALAQYYISLGLFSPDNLVEKWLQRAADHGSTDALYALGAEWQRQDGNAITPRVLSLWQQAAEEGHPSANYQLGLWYLSCEADGGQNPTRGIQHLCRAAGAGLPQARYDLYRLHYDESGRYTGPLRDPIDSHGSLQTLF